MLNQLDGIRSLKNIQFELLRTELLFLVVEISLVLSLSLLLLANLGELVVCNVKLSAINLEAVETRASKRSDIRLLIANESAG